MSKQSETLSRTVTPQCPIEAIINQIAFTNQCLPVVKYGLSTNLNNFDAVDDRVKDFKTLLNTELTLEEIKELYNKVISIRDKAEAALKIIIRVSTIAVEERDSSITKR